MIDLRPYVATLNNRPVAVFGPGGSGKSVTQALMDAGATVFIGDDRPENLTPFNGTLAQLLTPDFSNLAACAALILGPGVPLTHPKPHPVVQAARRTGVEVIGDIELFHRAYPKIKTIGITGTNGKSTTTALIAHILNACGKPAIACGNIGNPICTTTPTADTIMVIELSSFQLDLCPTFRPSISLHLNITPDHLDRHGTIENYIAIKERVFDGPGIGLCGVGDTASAQIFARKTAQNPARRMIPISVGTPPGNGVAAPPQGNGITVAPDGFLHDNAFRSDNAPPFSLADLPTLRGAHNHQNAAFAYATARACGCDPMAIHNAMKTYPGLPHRQLRVATIGTVDYINDSKATNADATEKALKTFDNMYWIVGGLQKAGGLSGLEPYAPRIARAYLIGSSRHDFARFMETHNIPYEQSETLDRAVQSAHRDAQADPNPATVLLSPACASYDQFQSYEHRGEAFTALVQNLASRDQNEKCA